MKKLIYLFLLVLLVTSCYKESDIPGYPFPEYLGQWQNNETTINGKKDWPEAPFNKVPHYVFGICQSELTLSTGYSLGTQYQYWKVDKTTTPYQLLLYKVLPTEPPSMIFKIIKEPFQGKMEISYQDSIVYYLSK